MNEKPRHMELFGSLRSPYVRKVRCVAMELGMAERIILRPIANTPQASDPLLDGITPVGKIPALRLPDGEVILESLLICERLDALGGSPRMIGEGSIKAANLFLHTVGDGMIDAAFRWLAESWRPGDAMTPAIQKLMEAKLARCLLWLEGRSLRTEAPMLGEITVAVALSYLDFRCGWLNWRETCPALASWHQNITLRPSMVSTPFDGDAMPLAQKI